MVSNNIIIEYMKKLSKQVDFEFELIQRIHIAVYDKSIAWQGKVNPIDDNKNLYFELLFQQNVIDDLISENKDKIQLSESIIIHELFHCKEMTITSSYMDYNKLYFNTQFETTRELLFNTAVHQWSEYYAYYNSTKRNERNIKLSSYLSSVEAILCVLYNKLAEESDAIADIQLPYNFITDMISFIHRSVMLIACYNSTKSRKYQRELEYVERSSLYQKYYPYLKELSFYMDSLYITYPNWVSEKTFMELGYKLFSFIKINGITYSTDDLSDNFIFVKK